MSLGVLRQGSIGPYLSSTHLLPDTNNAIVLLTNSVVNNDAADLLGQLLLETGLDNRGKIGYVAIARDSVETLVGLWPKMARELEARGKPNTAHKPLVNYAGLYHNVIGKWCIDVFNNEGGLKMCFQGHREHRYWLDHYHHDSFSWLLTRNEDVHRARSPVINLDSFILTFRMADDGEHFQQLVWRHAPDVPLGEIFYGIPPKQASTPVHTTPIRRKICPGARYLDFFSPYSIHVGEAVQSNQPRIPRINSV